MKFTKELVIVVFASLLSMSDAKEATWRELRRSGGGGFARSSIKLRTNTGSHNGSCTGDDCNKGRWILPTVLGVFFVIGLLYCIISYADEKREEQEKAERKARRKQRQEDELKIQTQLFIDEQVKDKIEENAISTLSSFGDRIKGIQPVNREATRASIELADLSSINDPMGLESPSNNKKRSRNDEEHLGFAYEPDHTTETKKKNIDLSIEQTGLKGYDTESADRNRRQREHNISRAWDGNESDDFDLNNNASRFQNLDQQSHENSIIDALDDLNQTKVEEDRSQKLRDRSTKHEEDDDSDEDFDILKVGEYDSEDDPYYGMDEVEKAEAMARREREIKEVLDMVEKMGGNDSGSDDASEDY